LPGHHARPLQEWKTIGVEQVSPIGGELHPVVLDSSVDSPESRQKSYPGIEPALEDLLAVLIGCLLELGYQGGDCVVLIVEGIAEEQQIAFFR